MWYGNLDDFARACHGCLKKNEIHEKKMLTQRQKHPLLLQKYKSFYIFLQQSWMLFVNFI
jgi:hypothetical protein